MTIDSRGSKQSGTRPTRAQPDAPPVEEAWTEAEEERAAILEYEAGLDRRTAEGQVRAWRRTSQTSQIK